MDADTLDAPPVTFDADRLRVVFDRFGPASYRLFLRCKALPESDVAFDPERESYTLTAPARFAPLLGAVRPAVRDGHPLWPALFEDQAALTAEALDARRYAVWSQCGNGKTLIGLEFARQVWLRTGGRVLIVSLNEVVPQWLAESERFYGSALPLVRLASRADLRRWCEAGEPGVAVTNYEKFNPDRAAGVAGGQVVNECRRLAGVVLDESSRLKGGGGKQKWAIIKSTRGVEYKLSLTATPAPNDTIEFASQASFLEKMRTDADIIWTYFTRDPKTHRWAVKPHARAAFFAFMSSWSVYVNDPKRYGWRLGQPDVPRPDYRVVEVEPTPEQLDLARVLTADAKTGQTSLVPDEAQTNAVQRLKLAQVARGFRYLPGATRRAERVPSNKPAAVAGIVRGEVAAGARVLVWTVFDEESRILAELLADVPGVSVLTGSVKPKDRPGLIAAFRSGESRVLVTRARMLGYGMNLQMCSAMVFSGWTDSFEDLYQAVRRAYRFGQAESLRVYFPVVRELEGDTLANVRRKEAEFERSVAEMEENYLRARRRPGGTGVAV